MKLLPKHALLKTNRLDEGDWNYRPLLGYLARRRFVMLLELLGEERLQTILEIGYGSGILLPELAEHCDALYGIDVHHHAVEVADQVAPYLSKTPSLRVAAAESLPFADHSIDCVVAVSSLEFVDDLPAACAEIVRVLAPNGVLLVVFPGHSRLLDWALRLATGNSARHDYATPADVQCDDRRRWLSSELKRQFHLTARREFPVGAFPIYHAWKLSPKAVYVDGARDPSLDSPADGVVCLD